MSSLFTKEFWKDTAERTVSSFAQGAATGWAAATFTSIGEVATTAEVAGLAGLSLGVLTFLKCLAAVKFGDPGTPSLVTLDITQGKHEPDPGEGADVGVVPPVEG